MTIKRIHLALSSSFFSKFHVIYSKRKSIINLDFFLIKKDELIVFRTQCFYKKKKKKGSITWFSIIYNIVKNRK